MTWEQLAKRRGEQLASEKAERWEVARRLARLEAEVEHARRVEVQERERLKRQVEQLERWVLMLEKSGGRVRELVRGLLRGPAPSPRQRKRRGWWWN